MGRQTDNGEVSTISNQKAELYATQLISYAAQAKQIIDQMGFTNTDIDDLDFVLPGDTVPFNAAPHIDKVYHPEGGGLMQGKIPAEIMTTGVAAPPSGWYLGRFNNVEWTTTANMDVILIAYQINQQVCEKINEKINGSTAIPTMTDSIKETMIDDATVGYGAGANTDLTTDGGDICPACDKMTTLCVENQAQTAYGFYTILADQ
ncbi:MAG: hypothetical protein DHS20C02_15270 [Micavibrio sp.]|nr:MAG: hypothetical protein DHS20C02_15270 [Micavibrio sp.]